jgi:hypothetical protein
MSDLKRYPSKTSKTAAKTSGNTATTMKSKTAARTEVTVPSNPFDDDDEEEVIRSEDIGVSVSEKASTSSKSQKPSKPSKQAKPPVATLNRPRNDSSTDVSNNSPPSKPTKRSNKGPGDGGDDDSPLRTALITEEDRKIAASSSSSSASGMTDPTITHVDNPVTESAKNNKVPVKPARSNTLDSSGHHSPLQAPTSGGYDMSALVSNAPKVSGYKQCRSKDENDDIESNNRAGIASNGVEDSSKSSNTVTSRANLLPNPPPIIMSTAVSAPSPSRAARHNMYEAIKRRKEFLSPGDSSNMMYHLNSLSTTWVVLTCLIHIVQWCFLLIVGAVVIPPWGLAVLSVLGINSFGLICLLVI